jgi:hypothetical protein
VRKIDHDPKLSHAPDALSPKIAQTIVATFGASVPDEVTGIIGELNDTHPQGVIEVEQIEVAFDGICPLEMKQDGDHTLLFCQADV